MLQISDALKMALLTDSTHKNIKIEFEGGNGKYSLINFAKYSDPVTYRSTNRTINDAFWYGTYASDTALNVCFNDAQYLVISGTFVFKSFVYTNIPAPEWFGIGVQIKDNNNVRQWIEYDPEPFQVGTPINFRYVINTANYSELDGIYVYVRKANKAYYDSEKVDSALYTWSNMSLNLGADPDDMPYSDTTSMYYIITHGENWHDYVVNNSVNPNPIDNNEIVKESFTLNESIASADTLKFGATDSAICRFKAVGIQNDDLVGRYFRASLSVDDIAEDLPLGRFRVSKVTKEGSHGIVTKSIEAYDGMYPLVMDATDWYGKYIGIINRYEWNAGSGSYPSKIVSRQVLSSLCNAFDYIGIQGYADNIDVESFTFTANTGDYAEGANILEYRDNATYLADSDWIGFANVHHGPVDASKIYKLVIDYDYETELTQYKEDVAGAYYTTFGFAPNNGGIIVRQIGVGNVLLRDVCVNDGDWFAVHPDTNTIDILVPQYWKVMRERNGSLVPVTLLLSYASTDFTLYSADFITSSNNFEKPLVYYNWQTYEVAKPSNITFRDVIRSLVEVTGKFFRYGRDGNIEFITCSMAGLYPSETLYPADDLYPAGGENQIVPLGRYRSFTAADSLTSDYGKIQIVASDLRTYVGNADKSNAYIMDDNVFYSDSVVTYAEDYDGTDMLPEVEEMLASLYSVISNVKYTPCNIEMCGMPWVECGDRVGVLFNDGGFESFVFSRVLNGVQLLTDQIESRGQENTEQIIEAWR